MSRLPTATRRARQPGPAVSTPRQSLRNTTLEAFPHCGDIKFKAKCRLAPPDGAAPYFVVKAAAPTTATKTGLREPRLERVAHFCQASSVDFAYIPPRHCVLFRPHTPYYCSMGSLLVELGFSPAADKVYQSLIRLPDSEIGQLAAVAQMPIADAVSACDELIASGLALRSTERANGLLILDPEVMIDRLLAAEIVGVAQRQEKLAIARASLHTLMTEYAPDGQQRHPTTESVELLDGDAILQAVREWSHRVQREVLEMDPATRYSPEQLAAARDRDRDALERGVRLRRLHSRSSRGHPATAHYHAEAAQHGVQVRFIGDVPMRMIVFDRGAGLVPTHPSGNGKSALLLRGEALTACLLLSFEQLWATAEPAIGVAEPPSGQPGSIEPTDLDRTLLKLMRMGIKDEAIARRLKVSVRTVRRQIADLMTRLEAGTRFEAGVQAAFRGWLQPSDASPESIGPDLDQF